MKKFIRLKGKIRPEKQRSAVSYEQSVLPYQLPARYPALNKAYYLRPFLLLILVFVSCGAALAQESVVQTTPAAKAETINGIVVSAETGEPLEGATVRIKNTSIIAITNLKGEFTLTPDNREGEIEVSFIGYMVKKISFSITTHSLVIMLDEDQGILEEVEINTGYQQIPKERATGSFVVVDNDLLERSASSDIFGRLKGVTNGLLFDRNVGNPLGISIRGRSTIYSDTQPLIVVDNFPFEGDINSLNPSDVLSVTLLKDAAAASIWGVRAGNGVIVITTKKGVFNKKTTVSFNSNVTIGEKPALFYQPQLSSAEFIEVEKFLFEKGNYNVNLNNDYSLISPVIDILQRLKNNEVVQEEVDSYLKELGQLDVRNQLNEYYNRRSIQQQYHFDVNGGGKNQSYFLSGGYSRNSPNDVRLSDDRFTLKANNSFLLLDSKLNLSSDVTFSSSNTLNINTDSYSPYRPYDQIANSDGEYLSVLRSGGLRKSFTDTVGKGSLLDWDFVPLEELNEQLAKFNRNQTGYRINLGANYRIFSPLTISANYQYYRSLSQGKDFHEENSFFVRNMVNTYSQILSQSKEIIRPVPTGGILNTSNRLWNSNSGRLQFNFEKSFNGNHDLTTIAGYEIREDKYEDSNYRLYGYDQLTATNVPVNVVDDFVFLGRPGSGRISNNAFNNETNDRYISYYANSSYIYNQKYIFSASFRKDESNLFGVKVNQKGVPLWSVGLAWNLTDESFIDTKWLSYLKVRATYGYNGNINKSVSAYLTATPSFYPNTWNTNFFQIKNPPNDALQWERVKNINFGIDFSFFNRVTGSVEYFLKDGIDLIGTSPIAPQTGISQFTGNTANTKANGIDIQLNTENVNGLVKWNTSFFLNYVKDKIEKYHANIGANKYLVNLNDISPVVGYPVNAVFGYRWKGLDEKGNPLGVLNNKITNDYALIINTNDREELDFLGSASPTLFGGIRNSFSYRSIDLSFNFIYKMNYYFRRKSINYLSLFGGSYEEPDYHLRWQKPGDELITNVPAMIYPSNGNQSDFYRGSSILIEKGDHIRLQDLQLDFLIRKSHVRSLPISDLKVYLYASNLGIVWRANNKNLDPEVLAGYPVPKSIALGLKANF